MKKILIAIVVLTSFAQSSHAATINNSAKFGSGYELFKPGNIAIIDTGYDNTVPQFNGKVLYEACFAKECPNGKNFQEGPGSAVLTKNLLSIKSFDHGTKMLSASLNTDSSLTYVFIRAYSSINNSIVSPTDQEFINILSWVNLNKNKLGISAVSFSGARNIQSDCPIDKPLSDVVSKLNASGIPVVVAAGNGYNYSRIGYPACVDPIISVGALDKFGIALYSNYGKDLDFYAIGTMVVNNSSSSTIQEVGTSLATQVFAASWMSIKKAKPSLTYNEQYALIRESATRHSSKNVPLGLAINVRSAINK